MSDTRSAYNSWASQYDTNLNKTRDLEATSIREILAGIEFETCLEIGCGTGKNTLWLIEIANDVTAVDLSERMLVMAKEKIQNDKVSFIQADITEGWGFASQKYNLITFSLVLEHIENLDPVFEKATSVLQTSGYIYIGELHPFKQYTGSKARFETEEGTQIVTCYNHNISDFTNAAEKYGLTIELINEYFDEDDKDSIPRILTMLFKKN